MSLLGMQNIIKQQGQGIKPQGQGLRAQAAKPNHEAKIFVLWPMSHITAVQKCDFAFL